jgi:membrane protein required for colicin V production
MNWLDIIILVIIVGSAIGGLFNGFIKTIFSLGGFILGVFLAGRYYTNLGDSLTFISNETAAGILAFIIIFAAVTVIFAILGTIFTKIVSWALLGWINRLLGVVLGAFMGALMISAILAVIIKFTGSSIISDSAMATFLLNYFPMILGLLPDEFNSIQGFFE